MTKRILIFRLWLLLAAISIVPACTDWPPGQSKFEERFSLNRASIEELLDTFQASEFGLIRDGGAAGGVTAEYKSSGQRVDLDDEQGALLAELLQRAEIFRVQTIDDDTFLMLPVGPEYDGHLIRVEYVHRGTGSALPSCEDYSPSDEDVTCEIHLEDRWYLHYFWTVE